MNKIVLSVDQTKAMSRFREFMLSDAVFEMVLTGFPGTGKSFLTKYLLDMIDDEPALSKHIPEGVICTATTNKAAMVLGQMTGRESGTIHSYLGLTVKDNYDTGVSYLIKTKRSTIKRNVLILIDEFSNIGDELLEIVRNSNIRCKILFVGDKDQIVEQNVNVCPVEKIPHKSVLTQIHRYAPNGPIDVIAAKYRKSLRSGIFSPIIPDGEVVKHVDYDTFVDMIKEQFKDVDAPLNHAKILTYTNKTVINYNRDIRAMHTDSIMYEEGEWVVTNNIIKKEDGSIAYSVESYLQITNVEPANAHGVKGAWLTLDDDVKKFQALNQESIISLLKNEATRAKTTRNWRNFYMLKNFFLDLRPIHASTIHKAQGSSYGTVFLDLDDFEKCFVDSDFCRMMYVAVSRAEHQVIICGELPDKYNGK